METPKNRNEYRTTRNPTPRLSERKKKLFFPQVNNQQRSDISNNNNNNSNNINDLDDDLDGIIPLDIKLNGTPKSRNLERLLRAGRGHRRQRSSSDSPDNENEDHQRYEGIKGAISFLSGESESDLDKQSNPSPTRRSLRLKLKSYSPGNDKENEHYHNSNHGEQDNNANDQHLQELFNTSLTLRNPQNLNKSFVSIDETSNEEDELDEEDNAQAKTSKTIANKNAQKRLAQVENNDQLDPLADNNGDPIKSPLKKIPKMMLSPLSSSSSSLSPPLEHVASISTKSFYAHPRSNETPSRSKHQTKYHPVFSEKGTKGRRSLGLGSLSGGVGSSGSHSGRSKINRGVYHKVKRMGKTLLDKANSVDIDLILHNLRNEKLKNLITSKRKQREQIEKIHKIFRQAENPIEMAKPLSFISFNDHKHNNNSSINNNNDNQTNRNMSEREFRSLDVDNDFSDLEFDDEYITDTGCVPNQNSLLTMEPVIPLIKYDVISEPQPEAPLPNRKFFKSKRTNVMEVRILDNIKASVCNGKIQLVEQKQRRRSRPRTTWSNEFSDEQATVEAILKNLDDTAFGDLTLNAEEQKEETEPTAATSNSTSDLKNDDHIVEDDAVATPTAITDTHQENILDSVSEAGNSEANDDINEDQLDNQSEESKDYEEFRNRLPYQTTNPEVIEQQTLLLDFLISNHICNEENFEIFIANPEKHREEAARILNNLVVVLNEEQMQFRDRLPYKTSDPKLIEQQQNFLYFLMENDICDEEHFDIFIANYDKRQAEAEAIIAEIQAKDAKINEILFNDQEQMPATTDQLKEHYNSDEHENEAMESEERYHHEANARQSQSRSLELPSIPLEDIHNNISYGSNSNSSFNSSHNSSTSSSGYINDNESTSPTVPEKAKPMKLFPIFYKDKRAKPLELPKSTRHTVARSRLWQGGFGANQRQIDAGQKQFGATQCKQCGLLYTMHEAEEEKIHREFHASLYILRFKGWIDEDIVAIYPEWGQDGRIIRLTNASYPKRKERLMEILKVVDKELGFASYILPDVFVAYLAVRKSQIVGLCLVQPLKEANKYLNIDGLDCCSLETYEAKCGISRIWVSPLNRRFHIGTKLISAVQYNTILGEDIPFSKLAFSAPTEMGRKFAQKITNMENFLVY